MADHRLQIILAAKDISGTALTKFKSSLGAITKSVFSLRGAIGTLAGTTGIGFLVTSSLKTADALAKTADKLGIGTGALQEYQYAANLSGVTTETLNMALQRFTRRTAEAAQGKGELKGVLEQYNIQVKDAAGNTRRTEDVLNDLADVIQRTESRSERLRIAFKAFDSEGAALVNMLRDGSDGLDAFRKKARDLGLVIDDALIRNAETAKDNLDTLGRVLKTQVTATIVELAPKISEVSGNILDWVAVNKELISQNIQSVFEGIAGAIDTVADAYQRVNEFLSVSEPESYLAAYKEQLEQTLVTQQKQLAMLERLGSTGSHAYDQLNQRISLTQDHLKIVNAELAAANNQFTTGGGFGGEPSRTRLPPSAGRGSSSGTAPWAPRADRDRWSPRVDRDRWAPRSGGLVGAESLDDLAAKHRETYAAMSDDITDWQHTAETAYTAIGQGVDSMSYNMSDALAQFVTESKINFKSLMNSIISDIIRMESRAAVSGLFSFIGGSFGGGASDLGAGGAGQIGGATTYSMNSGGYIGERVIGYGVSGKSYEFHPNEIVAPADKMKGGVSVDINVVNNLGQQAEVSQTSRWISMDRMVADVVLNKKITSRGFRQGMRS